MNPEQLIGRTLGHYHILRQVGYGGMATVFLAEDTNLEREVAVKVFWPRPGETRDFLRRFAREARVLAQLDHPNILSVYDYGETDGIAYLVTPYMPGGTLKDLLKERKTLSPVESLRLVAQMLNALQYAHERGLIHRDIKPGNMLFKADGSLVLADFGLVKVATPELAPGAQLDLTNQTGTAITGTPEYMSPEQIEGKAFPASDIYSVGIVIYEMLTGKRPFQSDSAMGLLMQQMHQQPHSLRDSNPYISPQLDAAVLRALEKDPARRYSRPADFLQALVQASSPGAQNNADVRRLNELTVPVDWVTPGQRPSQDAPIKPVGAGSSPAFPPQAVQAQHGPITHPGQTQPAGPSLPITPMRQFPQYVAPQQAPYAPQQTKRRRGGLLVTIFSLLVIGVIVTGLALNVTGHLPFVNLGQT
ncbi:MAG TPA: serine/threonine-protein kinase, partial [Ktedonobacteraceae bacterium]|nr:serine/threonine-protein kinase [Ktedonobacteraceae bacterium]